MKDIVIFYSNSEEIRRLSDLIGKICNIEVKEIEIINKDSKIKSLIKTILKKDNDNVELKNIIDLSNYQNVYIGCHIFSSKIPNAIKKYLSSVNIDNKIIIPYCTDSGDFGNYFEEIKKICNTSIVKKGYNFSFLSDKNDKEVEKLIKLKLLNL